MAYSYITATGTGAYQLVSTPPYIDKSHVSVKVDSTPFVAYTWVNDSTIGLTATLGSTIRVTRKTSPGTRVVDYLNGSPLDENTLDNDSLQAFYLAQEQLDDTAEALAVINQPDLAALVALIQASNVSLKLDASAISTFMRTVVDDLTADAALTTLGGGTAGKTLFSASTMDGALTSLGGTTIGKGLLLGTVPFVGFRNRIINGSMVIDQRNAGVSQSIVAGAALAYCADRFYAYCTGANISGQVINISNGQNRYRFTGAASNSGFGFGQRIEARNSQDLAGQTATLQAKLSSSSLTSIGWAAYYATTSDTFGTLASPTRTLIASGTFSGVNATEGTFSTQISVPSTATTGIEIVLTGGALLAGQTATIGDVQLEQGPVATTFERQRISEVLAACQRYFANITGVALFGYASAGGQSLFTTIAFKTTMRVVPTVVVLSNGSATILSSFGPNGISAENFGVQAALSSTGHGGVVSAILYASAEL